MASTSTTTGAAPMRVLVTGAAGQIAYSLLPMIARGDMLGSSQPVILHLLDIPAMADTLGGVVMELEDGAFPLLRGVVATTDVREAFTAVDVALLVGAMPRREGMERKDLLLANANIFKVQGKALNDYASRTGKVLVVGNPANTNALIARSSAPALPASAFSCLTRLDHNRAKSQLAKRLAVPVDDVRQVTIWGNHSNTQYPDVSHAVVGSARTAVRAAVADDAWLNGDFITTVQQRGAAVIKARKFSSAFSAATAIVHHIRDWVSGTPQGDWVSMGVISDGAYGVTPGLMFSYPVTISKEGAVSVVPGLTIDEFSRGKIAATEAELIDEKQQAFSAVGLE